MNMMKLSGMWDQAKGKIKEMWADLTDQDLDKVKDDTEKLIALIQEKTGETKEEIKKSINDISDSLMNK